MAKNYYSSLDFDEIKKLKYAIPTLDDVEFIKKEEKGRNYPTLILKDKRFDNLCISLVQNVIYFREEFYKKYSEATKENFYFEQEHDLKDLGNSIIAKLKAFNLPGIPLYAENITSDSSTTRRNRN